MAELNENKPGQSAEALAKAGYKKTKVGWIPEEWVVKNLIDLAEKIMVGIASSATHAYSDKGVVLFRNQNIKEEGLDTSDLLYVKEEYEKQHKNKRLKGGDVLTVRTGYPGISAVVPDKYEGAQCFTSLITRPHKDILDSQWLAYYVNSPVGKRLILGAEAGGAQKNVNAGALKKLKIPHLPLPEQRAIARILSTWDAAIDKLGQLIAKKQALKKGLMQQLLSGRVRFPEFVPPGGTKYKETKVGLVPEDWEVKILDELGSTYSGLSGKSKKDFGAGVKYIPYKNVFANSAIDTTYFDYVEINEGENQNRVKYGDIFFTVSSETPEEVGMSAVLLENIGECYLNSFCFGFRLDDFEKAIPEYLRFSLRSFSTRKAIARLAQGATRYNLSKRNVMKIPIALPSKAEQERIAYVLTGLYDEILKIETTKMHLETQKKGLMQQLLTGAVRIKD